MNGTNPITKTIDGTGDFLHVNSVFTTIQGEGPFSGRRALFIRLQYCNLACYWCDTDFDTGTRVHYSKLVRQAVDGNHRLVVITGGEPMLQNLSKLVRELTQAKIEVQIETNGTELSPGVLAVRNCTVVVSPKTGNVRHEYLNAISPDVVFKYVISKQDGVSTKDGLPISSTQIAGKARVLARPKPWHTVYVQPLDVPGKQDENARKCAALVLKYDYVLCLQTHKIVGVE